MAANPLLLAALAAKKAKEAAEAAQAAVDREPLKGEKGADGKTIVGAPGLIGPAGKDGADGKPGADGENGKDGNPGLDTKSVKAIISTLEKIEKKEFPKIEVPPQYVPSSMAIRSMPKGTKGGGGFTATDVDANTRAMDVNVVASMGGGLTNTELRASPVPVSGPLTNSQLRATPVPISGTVAISSNPIVSAYDSGNSKYYTSADGTTQFVGTAYDTRNPLDLTKRIIAAQQIVFASNVTSGLGITFVFEYGPDGTTWPISESRVVTDFATVRDLTLQNAGNFMRMRFTPSRALTGAEFINLDTTQWTIAPPAFVRLPDQQIEKANAAMGQSFAYLKGFGFDNKSADVPLGGSYTFTAAQTVLAAAGTYTTEIVDVNLLPSQRLTLKSSHASATNGVLLQWSDTAAFTIVRYTETETFRSGDVAAGLVIDTTAKGRYFRLIYTNGGTLQTAFYIGMILRPIPLARKVRLFSSAAGQTGQLDVATTSDRVAPGALANRTSIRLKNLSSSARALFYGFSSGVTIASGDELSAGESVDLDCDPFVEIYVICSSTAGGGVRCSWTELA